MHKRACDMTNVAKAADYVTMDIKENEETSLELKRSATKD
jgi:hypothetical protein